ncbi:deoxyribose-phosphate aldolase [Dictyoglomus thermophilum H-6-12]|uniref:Deoxyribose-phosphate aldolase n=2 Tax=Dictyoglomus thermophilum TaxID=14 RepID=B5YES7_DICT6|nr:deoxyribose-phosphate aldolase [Dictyoglomus thermophilum H-6-12]
MNEVKKMNKYELAQKIDHTLLKPNALLSDIEKLCKEAKEYGFYSVCINPYYISYAREFLRGSNVKICTVVDFPLGAGTINMKVCQVQEALKLGAEEFDMVINIGALKDRRKDYLVSEVKEVMKAAEGRIVKVIIETCYLTDEEKIYATEIIKEAGAHFVKTSTGFGPQGATVQDVRLLKSVAGDKLKVKAAGGIRTLEQALEMINAGADRIGTSSGVNIINELRE